MKSRIGKQLDLPMTSRSAKVVMPLMADTCVACQVPLRLWIIYHYRRSVVIAESRGTCDKCRQCLTLPQ